MNLQIQAYFFIIINIFKFKFKLKIIIINIIIIKLGIGGFEDWDLIKFYCEKIISIEKSSFMLFLNILPNKEIIALDNENVMHIID